MRKFLLFHILICSSLFSGKILGQSLNGFVRDASSGEPIIGAVLSVKGTGNGTSTDLDGKFTIEQPGNPPLTIIVSYVGYDSQELIVQNFSKPLSIKIKPKQFELKNVEITGSRISEKQKESPLTVESIDMIGIKECAQTSFYEALGTLKGVDLTSASLGFTIVNTRGFNSTSPVRSLQLIDGVDNQSPGLNFSLGNFLGCSELDVQKVEMIAGASSAYYGPNAFNGVINMTTRSPFVKPGLEVSYKIGERNLNELAMRWSQVIKNRAGEEKFGYKLNMFYMRANDWPAENMNPTQQSKNDKSNPGGYDAVNRYGDEYNSLNDFSISTRTYPGLGIWYRTGYEEKDIVDYNTRNLKLSGTFIYKIKKSELILASAMGNGTTVYQGDNRYSLKNILFFQNRIEFRKTGKFFMRFYSTNENSGDSYDAFLTALLLQNSVKTDGDWAQDYYNHWGTTYSSAISHFPGFPQPNQYPDYPTYLSAINPWLLANYPDSMYKFHNETRGYADSYVGNSGEQSRFAPGTAAFDSAFKAITSTNYDYKSVHPGSALYDRSALYHFQGEYIVNTKWCDIVLGGNYRMYAPNSRGTIFQDTGNVTIRNLEFGIYGGIEKKLIKEKLKINLTARLDKNENFNCLFSPAVSGVYSFNPKQIIRVSFSSAIRNPTLSDQYLFYHVGRAVLVGNLHGFNNLATLESMFTAFNTQNPDTLVLFNVKPIRPEEVKTIEVGYRATLFNNLYMDIGGYYSWYRNFIGYKIGADVEFVPAISSFYLHNIYRVAANSEDEVTTRGVSVGLTYFFPKFFTLSGNYSYNILDRSGSDDPLIPAFNTPENKFNFGFGGRDLDFTLFNLAHIRNISFQINFKWIEGFQFEGSPQFTGYVPTYNTLDGQISYHLQRFHSTFKLGASNLLDNEKFTVYGGPTVGRLAYMSILVELNHK